MSTFFVAHPVIPDPLTTVVGRVVDQAGLPVNGASVTTLGGGAGTTAADGSFSIPDVPTVLGDIVANATATIGGKAFRGRSASLPPVVGGTTDVGDIRLTGGRIALIAADNATATKNALVATGLFQAEDITIFDGSTPALSTLLEFDAVLVWSNNPFRNRTSMWNILADYVDQGGGVVLATYVFSQPWAVGGRILDPGYSPFAVTNSRFRTSGVLDPIQSDMTHPILAGVNSARYFVNSNYTNPPLTAGATLIARDTGGNNLIAVNAGDNVVGISIFGNLGFRSFVGTSGDVGLIFANALNFVR